MAKEQGVEKMVVRAKAELEDQLTDYYIFGSGSVNAPIEKGRDSDVASQILQNVQHNVLLTSSSPVHIVPRFLSASPRLT